MGRMKCRLVHRLLRAADSSQFELPKAWHVLARYRTAELFLRHPPPPAVKYGDEGLYRQLLAEQPLVKQQPLGLNSTTPSLARRFVEQQSRVMERLEVQERELMAAERARAQAAAAGAAHPASVQQEQMQLSPQQSASLREMAFNETQEALQAELQAAGRESGAAGGYLESLQSQEEETLQKALRKLQEQQIAALKS